MKNPLLCTALIALTLVLAGSASALDGTAILQQIDRRMQPESYEMYRKLIKGYMIRHKVKPGITGLAQVNGARGETDTVEKMEVRIRYDLEYLRHWSLRLDLLIIAKTVLVAFRDPNAY